MEIYQIKDVTKNWKAISGSSHYFDVLAIPLFCSLQSRATVPFNLKEGSQCFSFHTTPLPPSS